MKITSRTAIPFVIGASLLAGAFAQEPKDEDPPRLINPLLGAGQEADPHARLRELFVEVEERLLRIDDLLIDASTGDTSRLSEIGESGIDDLLEEAVSSTSPTSSGVARMLNASSSQGRKLLSGIDQIIEIVRESGST